jgi:hypothetical protein
MQARSNAHRRRTLIAAGLLLAAGVVALAAVARCPLDGSPILAVVQRAFTDAIGAEVALERVRLDLLLSRGLVVENFEMRFESWTISVPRAVVRPDLGALMGGEIRPSVSADRFAVQTEAANGAEAFLRLRELLEILGFPDTSLRLSGGDLLTRNGTPLLENIAFDLADGASGSRFTARAQQRGGGGLDVRGSERRSTGELLVDVYLDALATDDLWRWVSAAGFDCPESLQIPPLRATAEGHWLIRLGSDHFYHHHEFGFDVAASEAEHHPGFSPVPRMTAHLTGRLLTEPARATDPTAPPGGLAFSAGSFVRADASVARLRTHGRSEDEGETGSRMLFSGPLVATVAPRGRADQPHLAGHIRLDDAHLQVGDWFRKPCGTAARVRFESWLPPEGRRVGRIALELGTARARSKTEGDGRLTGETEWIAGEELGQWFPALEQRISGGRARLVDFEFSLPSNFGMNLELDGVEFQGRRMPFGVDALNGVVRLTSDGLQARALEARVSGVPLRVDLTGRVTGRDEPLKLSFAIRADLIDLERAGLGPAEVSDELASVSEALPPAFSGLAEASIALLRRERSWLSRLEVERGHFTSRAIRCGGHALDSVDLELAFRSLRLEVARLSFQRDGVRQAVSGTIDLNPLVPDLRLAATAF